MKRPQEVEDEIADLPGPPGSTECGLHLRRLIEDDAALRPETLVYVIREARLAECSEQDHLACVLLTGLQVDGTVRGGHCEAIIRKAARKGRFVDDEERLRDFRQRVYGGMFRQIRDDDREKQAIWEQAFFFAFKRRVLEVVETFRTQAERERAFDSLDTPAGSALPDPGLPLDEAVFRRMNKEQLYSMVTALDGKPGRAFYLRYVEGLSIKGLGGVAELMGVSDRMVQNYLAQAKEILSRDPVVLAIWDDLYGN